MIDTDLFDPRLNTRAELVEHIALRDGFNCYLCPRPFTAEDRPTIDHYFPLAKGGTWELSNLKLAHRRCNQDKADRVFLDDGTLETKPRRESYRDRQENKRQILDAFCEDCQGGRQLWPGETCDLCGHAAAAFPWTTRMEPKDCSHSGPWWCFMCSIGWVEREPAFVDAFGAGDELSDE